jgi:hypothetical protein
MGPHGYLKHMNQFALIQDSRRRGSAHLVLLACTLLAGCRAQMPPVKPGIEVTQVPVASIGGPEQMDDIEGRVIHAKRGQQIVLYAHSGVWWIQPLMNQPYTKIQSDSTWKNLTHLGTEYAVLLVDPGYRPASKLVSLPAEGEGVAAVTIVKGRSGAPSDATVIHFSGYDWTVRAVGGDHGGEANAYDPPNAWTDEKGYLHLRMAQRNGRWSCAEVSLNRSLGYGTYRFMVRDSVHLIPSAVLGVFTWDDTRSEGFHNELDIELSRWGDPKGKNAQYVVQPFYVPDNLTRFTVPAGPLTHTFRWEPGKVSFETLRGSLADAGANVIEEHVFTSGIPTPASETIHIDLYDFHHAESLSQQPAEVVIERFEYSP